MLLNAVITVKVVAAVPAADVQCFFFSAFVDL